MKNGTPTNAVITPIGSSAGLRAVRAAVSASTRNVAPSNAAPGNEQPVIAAPQEPHRMRHDQADESDDAAHRDGHRRQQRREREAERT